MKYILFISFIIVVISQAQAQCIDSLSIVPSAPCAVPDFQPVCGCDNKTYRNECEAKQRNGVLTVTQGSCSGFEFDILPNYLTHDNYYNIHFTLVQAGVPSFARLFIVDSFGKLWYQFELPAKDHFDMDINLMHLSFGLYFIYVYTTNGVYRYKSFVKVHG